MTRVAIVTGAARGIGAAVVLRLVADGWAVLAVDLCADDPAIPYPLATRADLSEVVARAAEAAGDDRRTRAVVADVRDIDALRAAVDEAEREWGGLDAAIAGAGVIAGGVPTWEMPGDQLTAVLDVDLGGVISLARASIPAILRRPPQREGRFIAISSAAATRGLPLLAAYGGAKAGVEGFIRGLAAELRGSGVTANAVSPGSTSTRMLDESARLYGLDAPERFATQQLTERLLAPDEIASAVCWLAGPDGGAITGTVVTVDAGLSV